MARMPLFSLLVILLKPNQVVFRDWSPVALSVGTEEEYEASVLSVEVAATDLVATSSIGFILYGSDGLIVELNDAAATFFNVDSSALSGAVIRDIPSVRVCRPDGSVFQTEDYPVVVSLRERRPVKDVICGLDVRGLPVRWAKVSTNLIERGGEVQGVISTWVDCTSQVELSRVLALGDEFLTVIESVDTPESIYQTLCDVLVDSGHYPLAWIGTDAQDEWGTVEMSYSAGEIGYLFDGMVSTLATSERGVGVTGTALRTQEVCFTNNVETDDHFSFWRQRLHDFDLWAAIAVPIAGEPARVLTVYDRHPLAFDQPLIHGVVEIVGMVTQRIETLQTLERVRQGFEGAIAAIGQITEERDPYTEGHQIRVASLGGAIARRLGFDEQLSRLIELSGEVHDVGKVAVPAEILTKPGRLSALEYKMVQEHCRIGAGILSKASMPWPITEVAMQHHERLDGSGYPLGLSGDDIVMPARIIAVADVMEAMMNHRPYRPALGLDTALAEIQAQRGICLDADVVDACVAIFEEGFGFVPVNSATR